jgi:WD40 repeat protein
MTKTVRLWDTVTGATLQTLEGHSDWVRSAAFSLDGKLEQGLFILNDWVVEGKEKFSGSRLNIGQLMRLSGIKSLY